jgi:multiple sugar transport system substrate-binding protein
MTGRTRRRFLATATTAVAASGLLGTAGCAGTYQAPGAQPTAARPQPVTLDLQHRWDGPAREPIVLEQIRKFQEKYPHATVNVTQYQQAGETTAMQAARFLAAIAAGTPPDVFMVHAQDAIGLAERNALTFLDPYLKRDRVAMEEVWFPSTMALIQLAGPKTFALPQTAAGDNPYVFFNKAMLRAVGAAEAQLATWEGLVTASRSLTRAEGDGFAQIGFPFPGAGFTDWQTVNGGELLSRDGRKTAFNTAEGRGTLTYLTDAVRSLYGSAERLNAFLSVQRGHTRGPTDSAWINNKMGVWASGPWVWQETPTQAAQLEMGAARMPVNKANPRSRQTTLAESVWTWAIGAGVKRPDDAWLLERWMSFDEGHKGLMIGMGRATMVKKVVQDKAFFDANPGWNLVLETIAAATPCPPCRAWDKVKPVMNRVVTDVLSGKAGVADALTQAERDAQVILDEAYRA